jgi:hypothetical protein
MDEPIKTSRAGRLTKSRVARKDEFYTKYEDIKNECDRYAEHFRHKRILCPCDCPGSNFIKYFEDNFDKFELASLNGVGFNPYGPGFKYTKLPGEEPVHSSLLLKGDYRSPEVLKILKESDIVVTNPPFSLFRNFVEMVVRYNKHYLVLGNIATIGSKDMVRLVKEGNMRFGYFGVGAMEFVLPEHYPKCMRSEINPDGTVSKFASVSSITWATNLPVDKPLGHELTMKYDPDVYKKYDGYDAIEVPMLRKIPIDYEGLMGVPITFIVNWNPEQFEIVSFSNSDYIKGMLAIDGDNCFARVMIRHKNI